jgi:hypothetical protein
MTTQTTRKSQYKLNNGKCGTRISDVPETLKEIVIGLQSHFESRLVSVQIDQKVYEVEGMK